MSEPQRLYSVTTLIKEGLGTGRALVEWNARTVGETAFDKITTLKAFAEDSDRAGAVKWLMDSRWKKSGKAADRGTTVHGLIEDYAYGRTPEVPEEMTGYDTQIRRFLAEHEPEFQAAEAPVYNLTHGYAGTMDMILVIGGKRCIVDAKTTDKGPDARSRPPYAEIALQLVAYANCEVVGTSPAQMRTHHGRRYYIYDEALEYAPMPELDGALALIVSPVDYRLVPVAIDEDVWRAFGHIREAARWQLETSKRVLGPDITVRKAVAA